MSFEAWKEGHVAASEGHIPVVAPLPGMKREAVSSRLRQTLVHPDKSGTLVGLAYTADGRRLFAGHNRSSIVQFWDAESGQQLNRIETGPAKYIGFREYFLLSPDGRSLYFNRGTIRARFINEKDKRQLHYEVDSGGVSVWDVETAKPCIDLELAPDHGVVTLQLSPDGATLWTHGIVSGDYEPASIKWFGALWDTRTGKRRGEFSDIYPKAAFSPDSQTLLTIAVNNKSEATAFLFLDSARGKVRHSIPIEQEHSKIFYCAFSPNGKRIACSVQNATGENWLTLWDVASGREISSFKGEKQGYFDRPVFSPDGRMLAVTQVLEKQKMYLIDAGKGKLVCTVPLADEGSIRQPIFSPDGKWIAVLSQYKPTKQSPYRVNPDMLPQPRILLLEAATGEVRETIIAPPAVAVSLCFSPNGKTLASGGDGRVLLWDMTKPPGIQNPAR